MDKKEIKKIAYGVFLIVMIPLNFWFYDYRIENEQKKYPRLKKEDRISGYLVSKKKTLARGGMILILNNGVEVRVTAAKFAQYIQLGDSIHKADYSTDIYVFRGDNKPLKFEL